MLHACCREFELVLFNRNTFRLQMIEISSSVFLITLIKQTWSLESLQGMLSLFMSFTHNEQQTQN